MSEDGGGRGVAPRRRSSAASPAPDGSEAATKPAARRRPAAAAAGPKVPKVPADDPRPTVTEPVPVVPPVAEPTVTGPARRLPKPLNVLVAGLVLGVLLGGIGAGYVLSRHAVYRSSAVLMLDQEPALAKSENDGLLSKLVRLRLKYVGIVSTTVFADPVAKALGRPVGEVHAALSATAPPTSLLLTIQAETGSADGAREIAQGAADELVRYLQDEEVAAAIPEGNRVTLTVVSAAPQGTKASPSGRRALLAAVFLFAVVAAAGALAADALRRKDR